MDINKEANLVSINASLHPSKESVSPLGSCESRDRYFYIITDVYILFIIEKYVKCFFAFPKNCRSVCNLSRMRSNNIICITRYYILHM